MKSRSGQCEHSLNASLQYLFAAIKKFLEQASAFPSLTGSDIVADYCRSSQECEEICRLLEGKRKSSEVFNQDIIQIELYVV